MAPSINRLLQARDAMLTIISSREDGARYVPIFLRLEKEIAAHKGTNEDYQRILQMAAERSSAAA
ncbi:hypothetical protein [Tranquillimonas alkanivorans]|uniref:Uncharacterized protein n=1 Tax=Tranquillimonas alkanivorans TaxID=441119 RepID=A0A1I5R0E8_9RHOB|nr:hypothetical protein [Tranquillimonas alkanivorans]SFP51850.1 hypothetical protein SAMN04488047_107204 [Tranquillimonas alkanivorans]